MRSSGNKRINQEALLRSWNRAFYALSLKMTETVIIETLLECLNGRIKPDAKIFQLFAAHGKVSLPMVFFERDFHPQKLGEAGNSLKHVAVVSTAKIVNTTGQLHGRDEFVNDFPLTPRKSCSEKCKAVPVLAALSRFSGRLPRMGSR